MAALSLDYKLPEEAIKLLSELLSTWATPPATSNRYMPRFDISKAPVPKVFRLTKTGFYIGPQNLNDYIVTHLRNRYVNQASSPVVDAALAAVQLSDPGSVFFVGTMRYAANGSATVPSLSWNTQFQDVQSPTPINPLGMLNGGWPNNSADSNFNLIQVNDVVCNYLSLQSFGVNSQFVMTMDGWIIILNEPYVNPNSYQGN